MGTPDQPSLDEIIRICSQVRWATRLKEWRYKDVEYEGEVYTRGDMLPAALAHLLKRVHIDGDLPPDTTLEQYNELIRNLVTSSSSWVYGFLYHNLHPQWGFYDPKTGWVAAFDAITGEVQTALIAGEKEQFFTKYPHVRLR